WPSKFAARVGCHRRRSMARRAGEAAYDRGFTSDPREQARDARMDILPRFSGFYPKLLRFDDGRRGVRIDHACEEFLRDCANVRKLSEHTTRAYRLDLARFTRFAGAQAEVTSFDRSVLVQYVEY